MKILLIITLVILLLIPFVIGIYLIIFNMFYRKYFSKNGEFLKGQNKKFKENLNENDCKIFDDFEDIKCLFDGKTLTGKHKNCGSEKLAILSHSFGCDFRQMAKISKFFMDENFNVLAINLLNGEEKDSLLCWVKRMIEINPNYKIVLFGIGLGGASQFLAIDCLPQNVKLIVSESGFADEKKQLLFTINKGKIKPPIKLFFNFLNKTKGVKFDENKILDDIKKSKIPILLLHDEKDEIVPIEVTFSLQKALPTYDKDLIILKDCNHGEGIEKQGYLFKNSIKKYLKKYELN